MLLVNGLRMEVVNVPPKSKTKSRARKPQVDKNKHVYMIISKDDYKKEGMVNVIIADCFNSDYSLYSLGLTESISDIENTFTVKSLVNNNRVIFINYSVKQLSKKFVIKKPRKKTVTYEDILIELLSNVGNNLLVFLFPDTSDKRKSLQKFVMDKFNFIEIPEPKDEDILSFIKQYAKENGYKISDAVVKYIFDNVAKDIGIIKCEMDKLFLYIDSIGKDNVSIDELKNVIVDSADVAVFDVIDSIAKKDKKKTFSLLDGYMSNNNNVFSLIALLQRSFRMLYYANTLGKSFADRLHINPFIAKKYSDRVRLFSEKELGKKLMFLLSYECELKSGLNPENAVYDIILELLK